MGKLREVIEYFEERVGERVEAVAIGGLIDPLDDSRPVATVEPISRESALSRLEMDREYDGAFASEAPPHAIYAWTRSWVLLLTGYDGSSGPSWVPRKPARCAPALNGNDRWR